MRELIDAIVSGEYAEGSRMPPEAELRQRLGVSRGALRDAMLGLEERGLVEARSGRGQTVRQREDWDTRFADVLLACVARGPDPDVLSHAIRARSVLEREAAAHASEFAADADFDLLAARVTEMEQALEPGATRTFDADDPLVSAEVWFHRTLALLSDNPVLAKLVEPLHLPSRSSGGHRPRNATEPCCSTTAASSKACRAAIPTWPRRRSPPTPGSSRAGSAAGAGERAPDPRAATRHECGDD